MKATAEKEQATFIKCVDCGRRWVCGTDPHCEGRMALANWIKFGNIEFPRAVKEISLEIRFTEKGQLEIQVTPKAD